jgi:hypothetical protein
MRGGGGNIIDALEEGEEMDEVGAICFGAYAYDCTLIG